MRLAKTSYERGYEDGLRALVFAQLKSCFGALDKVSRDTVAGLPCDRLLPLLDALLAGSDLSEFELDESL